MARNGLAERIAVDESGRSRDNAEWIALRAGAARSGVVNRLGEDRMPQVLIRTPSDAARELDLDGGKLSGLHEQIVDVLSSRLGVGHGDLLAKPKAEPDGSITWTTRLAGPVTRATELPEEASRKLERRAAAIRDDIRGLADQLRREAAGSSQVVARTLELALSQPPGEWLFGVDGKPVIVLWGHAAPGMPLPTSAASPAEAVAPVVQSTIDSALPASAARRSAPVTATIARRFIPWLLLAAVALAALWGVKQWSAARSAASGLDLRIAEAESHNKELEAELVNKASLAARFQCVPDPPASVASAPAPQVPASAPAPEVAASEPAPAASAPEARVPASAPAPAAKASAPAVKRPAAKPPAAIASAAEPRAQDRTAGRKIVIPPGALERHDLSFLEGDWQLGPDRLDIYDTDPDNSIGSYRGTLHFEANGVGTRRDVQREEYGHRIPDCRGAARARTDGVVLYVETSKCFSEGGDDSTMMRNKFECRVDAQGETVCQVVNEDGHRWEAPLKRLK